MVASLITNPTFENQMDAAQMQTQLGMVLLRAGRYREAEPYIEQLMS